MILLISDFFSDVFNTAYQTGKNCHCELSKLIPQHGPDLKLRLKVLREMRSGVLSDAILSLYLYRVGLGMHAPRRETIRVKDKINKHVSVLLIIY